MNFSHRLLSSALLAGAVFSATVLPLVTLGSKPVTIQLEDKPVFVGQLRELAAPYIALSTGLSLGVGAVSLSLLSWQQASRKAAHREAEIAALRQQLIEQEAVIEQLKFSDMKLQTSGLEQFLQTTPVASGAIASTASGPAASVPERGVLQGELLEATSDRTQSLSHPMSHPVSQPITPDRMLVAPVSTPVQSPVNSTINSTVDSRFSTDGLEFFLDEPIALPARAGVSTSTQPGPALVDSVPSTPSQAVVTPITEPVKLQALKALPAAQTFSSFVRQGSLPDATQRDRSDLPSIESSTQLHELLSHLKQVMTQLEQLQTTQHSASRNGKRS